MSISVFFQLFPPFLCVSFKESISLSMYEFGFVCPQLQRERFPRGVGFWWVRESMGQREQRTWMVEKWEDNNQGRFSGVNVGKL